MSDAMKALDEIEAALFECPAGVDDTLSKALVALDTLRAALTSPADDEVEEIRARNRRNLQGVTIDTGVPIEVTDVSDLLRHVDRLSAELAKERERRGEVPEFPLGAIENGRAFMDRVEHNYDFQSEGGPLSMCSDWLDARNCFEHLALWATAVDPILRPRRPQPGADT